MSRQCGGLACLWLLAVVATVRAQLPSVVDSYEALVAINFDDSYLHNDYSLSYTESFDARLNAYRTRGRFRTSSAVELFFFDSDVVFTYDAHSPDTTCTFSSWSTYPQRELVRPSVRMFDRLLKDAVVCTWQRVDRQRGE
jgi:hypothetical protein